MKQCGRRLSVRDIRNRDCEMTDETVGREQSGHQRIGRQLPDQVCDDGIAFVKRRNRRQRRVDRRLRFGDDRLGRRGRRRRWSAQPERQRGAA
jgi:hypothetical protein